MKIPPFWLCALLVSVTACASAPVVPPVYEIQTTKPQDQIAYEFKNNTAYFDITSPGGTGGAFVVHTQGDFPKAVMLRFHLKGLESLQLRFESGDVQASVASDGNHDVTERGHTDAGQDETILTQDNSFWLPIEIVSPTKNIPLEDGYFQVLLPRAFYASRAREFSVEWIDFFR